MNILLAEYASVMEPGLADEGLAMLRTLREGFQKCGHAVRVPRLQRRNAATFSKQVERLAKACDAGLVIAPDRFLYDLTALLERFTINLGCPVDAVMRAADKLTASQILSEGSVTVPEINPRTGPYIIKPRDGCGAEGIQIVQNLEEHHVDENELVSKFIVGEHISVSLVIGRKVLPLSINKQHLRIDEKISYLGNTTPYDVPNAREVIAQASAAAQLLGCEGYVGVDIVLEPDGAINVVDVNPRPTTAIISIDKVLGNVADLILKARLGLDLSTLPKSRGRHTFVRTSCVHSQLH
jgi:predicted ATP-grasp superfamily ATP-dependent carboligase